MSSKQELVEIANGALFTGKYEAFKALINSGLVDIHGDNFILSAIYSGNTNAIRVAVECGATLTEDESIPLDRQNAAVYAAIKRGDVRVLKCVLDTFKIDINGCDKEVLSTAEFYGKTDIIKYLREILSDKELSGWNAGV